MSTSLRSMLPLAVVFLSVTASASAQIVQGTVRDRVSNRELAELVITLTNTGTRKAVVTRSDSAGEFAFRSLKPGTFVLSIDRDGRSYPYDLSLVVNERAQLYIHVPNDTSALVVSGTSSRVRKLESSGFYERYEKGRGQFILREDIEKRAARSLPDLLGTTRGVRIVWDGRGGDAILRHGGGAGALSGGGVCRPSIYLDGVLIRPGGNQEPQLVLEQVETPDHVEAIEVYTGAAQLPTAYSDLQSVCGVILIWTR